MIYIELLIVTIIFLSYQEDRATGKTNTPTLIKCRPKDSYVGCQRISEKDRQTGNVKDRLSSIACQGERHTGKQLQILYRMDDSDC